MTEADAKRTAKYLNITICFMFGSSRQACNSQKLTALVELVDSGGNVLPLYNHMEKADFSHFEVKRLFRPLIAPYQYPQLSLKCTIFLQLMN